MLGKGRLSMQAIMERLTAKAYNEYDGAVRAHMVARLLQEAVAVAPESKPSTRPPLELQLQSSEVLLSHCFVSWLAQYAYKCC